MSGFLVFPPHPTAMPFDWLHGGMTVGAVNVVPQGANSRE